MTGSGLSFLSGVRLRRRRTPPKNVDGFLQVGSEAFRRACAIHEDGIWYLIREQRKMVWAEHKVLSQRWHLPDVKRSKLVTALDIERLHDPGGTRVKADAQEISPGAKKFVTTLHEAAAVGASDIKLFLRPDQADLRLRLGDAEYTHGDPWTTTDAAEAISWLFDGRGKGDGASSERKNEHQSFSILTEEIMPPGVAGLRGDRGPHGTGSWDSLVARILYTRDGNEAGDLEQLGFDPDVMEVLAEERRSESGLVLIGGSTGDGKSTTLVRQIERLYQERNGRVSIYTVEDPIEYPIHGTGILQLQVPVAAIGEEREQAYAELLKHVVRRNPDVLMISEIRSKDDANVILQFVTSGHKVLSTVHTSSANNVPFRLISLGVNPHELAQPGVVSLVMRQKLVEILCPDCAVQPPEPLAARIRLWTGAENARPMLRNREGCPTCLKGREHPTARKAWGGISRKRAVAEYIRVDDTYRGLVETHDSRGAKKYWLTPVSEGGLGGITVEDRVRMLVAGGEVDYADFTNEPLPGAALREVR